MQILNEIISPIQEIRIEMSSSWFQPINPDEATFSYLFK